MIAEVGTDHDAFSDAEAAALENHGYFLAEAAVQAHLPSKVPAGAPPARPPHPAWLDEASVHEALLDDGKRKLRGRF